MNPNSSKTIEFQLDLNPEKRRQFIADSNAHLQQARAEQTQFISEKKGREAARIFSLAIDELLQNICQWLTENSPTDPTIADRIAIVAQGGYGRGQMNPFSDIDLLILMPDSPTPGEQAFVKSFLYLLWDLSKFELGHATKRVQEATECIGQDLDSTTALLELRLIYGSRPMLEQVERKVSQLVRGPAQKWFIVSKLNESRNRKEKFGGSIYLLEPNVKEGEGGLRDVHSLKWLSYSILQSSNLEALVQKDVLRPHELAAMGEALDFHLSIRTALHLAEGRKLDALSFTKQPEVARALGYESDSQLLAEEKMMKDYYLHARVIDRYSLKATRAMTTKARGVVGGVLEAMRRRSLNDIYYIRTGLLYQKAPDAAWYRKTPWRIMDAFRTAAVARVQLSEDLKQTLEECHDVTDTDAFRADPHVRDLFMEVMAQKSGAGPTVHAMHETGILADYMPEFRKLFCLVRIDHYHRYTVDEHLIKTLYELEDLVSTGAGQRPELVQEARNVQRHDLLNLSLLLHDIGKGEGHGHVLRGAIISQKMTQRMGLPPEDQEVVRQLILQHLKMVHISQRRDLEDPTVIAEMAGTVPDLELLKMLYILTYCDTRAVGPGAWSDWKGMLLSDLYRKTVLFLQGQNPIPPMDAAARERLQAEVRSAAPAEITDGQIAQFLNNAPPKYLTTMTPPQIARHIQMQQQLDDQKNLVSWHVDEPKGLNYTEITAMALDVRGLLSILCGALSSKDINILSLQAFSTKDGHAIDVFQVTDLRGNPLPEGFRLDRLKQEITNVLLKKKTPAEAFPMRTRARQPERDVSVVKPAQIILNSDSSPDFTILEVKAYDRPGLLYDITRIANEHGCYIHLAIITTEAYRVVDVFYITDLEFNKLSQSQMRKLEKNLEEIL